jgi:hypothetical protein
VQSLRKTGSLRTLGLKLRVAGQARIKGQAQYVSDGIQIAFPKGDRQKAR